MLGDLWGGATDLLGDTLSSILESILNATIFKLCYYIERMLCWIVGILMDLFNIFSGLETVTYNGSKNFLINIFFANKAINNIFWAMAIIGFILVFVFTGWSVIRKIFDINAKHQESLGQIIWSGIRSIFLIVGLTLVINVVLTGTGILMQQIDFIFNNAYHLDQPQERDFTDEEYAAMGRVLATIGNYSMVPSSNSRYNLNACFNAIRGDMELLQKQGVFDYSYYQPDAEGNIGESWQSVLSQIAKSTDLRRDVMIDVYNEGVATSITAAMDYLRNTKDPRPVDHVEASYTVTERANLDRMIFLMGTMRAVKNSAYNENPAFDDALRGPYYYNENRDIYSFSDVNRDFNIGFEMDYVLVWLASVAIIVDLTIVILNCIARIFNMLFHHRGVPFGQRRQVQAVDHRLPGPVPQRLRHGHRHAPAAHLLAHRLLAPAGALRQAGAQCHRQVHAGVRRRGGGQEIHRPAHRHPGRQRGHGGRPLRRYEQHRQPYGGRGRRPRPGRRGQGGRRGGLRTQFRHEAGAESRGPRLERHRRQARQRLEQSGQGRRGRSEGHGFRKGAPRHGEGLRTADLRRQGRQSFHGQRFSPQERSRRASARESGPRRRCAREPAPRRGPARQSAG